MNSITNIPPAIKTYTPQSPKQINFCGTAPVEKLGKDIYVGARKFLIQETAFFREPETLEFVKEYLTTALKHKPEINIIDGACSKGYETYTLAMMLDNAGKKINITGFDIGTNAIEEAKKGVFFIKQVTGNPEVCSMYKMGYSAFGDDYLAFAPQEALTEKQAEYQKMFNEFFTEIPYKEKFSLHDWLMGIMLKKWTPKIETKAFQIKSDKADTCKFIQGDILRLDEIVPEHSADVLLFRNALYHLTTKEGPLNFKIPLDDEMIIPMVKNVVEQVDKAIQKDGLFVIGEHTNDHILTTGKTLYNELENHNFSPVLKNSDGSMSYIWKKN